MLTEAFRVAHEFLQELGEKLEVFELVELANCSSSLLDRLANKSSVLILLFG